MSDICGLYFPERLQPTASYPLNISSRRMDYTKAEQLLEGIVVSVVMEEGVAVKQAETGDKTVDGFMNSHSLQPEGLVVLG